MNEGLRQTIERVKQQNTYVMPVTNMVQHVQSDIQRLIAAVEQLDAVKQERDGYAAWANTLESLSWHDAGECPYCKANTARSSTDVLEPDKARIVCYCNMCRQTWFLELPAGRIVTVGRIVVLPAGPGMVGKSHTQEGPL